MCHVFDVIRGAYECMMSCVVIIHGSHVWYPCVFDCLTLGVVFMCVWSYVWCQYGLDIIGGTHVFMMLVSVWCPVWCPCMVWSHVWCPCVFDFMCGAYVWYPCVVPICVWCHVWSPCVLSINWAVRPMPIRPRDGGSEILVCKSLKRLAYVSWQRRKDILT